MRKLNTRDLFSAARLIKKLDIKNEAQEILINSNREGKDNTEIGINLMFLIIDKVANQEVESEFYKFLAGPLELDEKEVGNINPIELFKNIKEIASGDEFKAFFENVATLMK